jgi:hypothetical protein
MGLDMYAFTTSLSPTSPVDFEIDCDNATELHYWRKHPNLHGWMEQLYRKKGGRNPHFNMNVVALTESDIEQLRCDIESCLLPETSGFFFGQSRPEDIIGDLVFISEAQAALAKGLTVFYTSWW